MNKRLSWIETQPVEITEDLQWLYDAAKSDRMTQIDMLKAFNLRLKAKGRKPTSSSALNRYVLRVRDGEVRRPVDPSGADSSAHGIFTDRFREQLVAGIGESAVRAQEAALSALVNPSS